jgi:hypothetical protein
MNRQDKAQIIWAASFVVSGIILGLAIWMIPSIGILATASFIVVYIGISAAFLFVFREINSVKAETLENLKEKYDEIREFQKTIEKKFYSRKIDQDTFKQIEQHYERKLAELEVKINKIERNSKK